MTPYTPDGLAPGIRRDGPLPSNLATSLHVKLWLTLSVGPSLFGCAPEPPTTDTAVMPEDTPQLHHTGLNTTNSGAALDWYMALWPSAIRSSFAGLPAVGSDMYLVFREVGNPPSGGFREDLGRPDDQSAFWHIGAFANTTDMAEELAVLGIRHLTLHIGPEGEGGVWRSGLAPYAGVLTEDELGTVELAEPRPGGFSYILGPDGALFELTGGPDTSPSLSHIHFFHEQPRCAANWYVATLGMSLPPVRNDGGTSSIREPYEPCEAEVGPPGWPSLELAGTLRQPRATVIHGNGSMSFYPRQCVMGRCGTDQPLVPSRGQVLDHVGFSVADAEAWHGWLESQGVVMLEDLHDVPEGSAFMFEGPDRLAIELVQLSGG